MKSFLTMKFTVKFLVALTLLLILIPIPNVFAADLYEYYNTDDDNQSILYSEFWFAQTFTVGDEGHNITSVKLLLFKENNPAGVFNVTIRYTDEDGYPIGSDLTNGSIVADSVTVDPAGDWYEITLDKISLAATTKYAIVCSVPSGNATDKVKWRQDRTSPTYTGGCSEYSNCSGTSWVHHVGYDFMFEVWGEEAPPPEYDFFGNKDKTHIQGITEVITGSWFNLPQNARILNMYVFVGGDVNTSLIKGVIYRKVDNSCVAESAAHQVDAFTGSEWHELDFAPPYEEEILGTGDYILMITSQYYVDFFYKVDGQNKGYQRNWEWDYEDTFPDPLEDAGTNTREYAIYVTYEAVEWHKAEVWWGFMGTIYWHNVEFWFGKTQAGYIQAYVPMIKMGMLITGLICVFLPMTIVGYKGKKIGMAGAISAILILFAGIGLLIGFSAWEVA